MPENDFQNTQNKQKTRENKVPKLFFGKRFKKASPIEQSVNKKVIFKK